ncbi:MAG: hypothetical protein ACREH5_04870, partial [Candidatus Omnitrophota bacterium]
PCGIGFWKPHGERRKEIVFLPFFGMNDAQEFQRAILGNVGAHGVQLRVKAVGEGLEFEALKKKDHALGLKGKTQDGGQNFIAEPREAHPNLVRDFSFLFEDQSVIESLILARFNSHL